MALALGALTMWHAVLISRGETSIERHINKKERRRLQAKGRVSGEGTWVSRWVADLTFNKQATVSAHLDKFLVFHFVLKLGPIM